MTSFLKSLIAGIDRTSAGIEKLGQRTREYRIKTEAKLSNRWFQNFRIYVDSALKHAELNFDLEKEWESNPTQRQKFQELYAKYGDKENNLTSQVPDWACSDAPSGPDNVSTDSTEARLQHEGFEEAREEHEEFVKAVRQEIEKRPHLRKPFNDILKRQGLPHFYEIYFSEPSLEPLSGSLPKNKTLVHEAQKLSQNDKKRELQVTTLAKKAESEAKAGKCVEAQATANEALNVAREIKALRRRHSALLTVIKIQIKVEDTSSAKATTTEAIKLAIKITDYNIKKSEGIKTIPSTVSREDSLEALNILEELTRPSNRDTYEKKHPVQPKTSRIIEPSIEELDLSPTPLEPGEREVLDFFDRNLDPEWEIYIQPHLNGLRPDFVLLNPKVGIAVFEVKNWNFNAVRYFPKMVGIKRVDLWAELDGKQFSKEIENPFRKISIYRDRIFNIYCPRLEQKAGFAAITGGVIFPSATRAQGLKLQQGFLGETQQDASSTYLPVCGRDELFSDDIEKVFPDALRKNSKVMTTALADDLRGWLVEPDFSKEQRTPLTLDSHQRQLAETRTPSGFRRIKGPAGSGKSVVLAAKAARLASQGKTVLIVTYNITLWHYLRDMIRRNITNRDAMDNIEFTHFHEWCKDVCEISGFGSSYSEMFLDIHKLEDTTMMDKDTRRTISNLLEPILDHDVPKLAISAASSDKAPRYDAILVDEGQDYLPLWWSALKNCRKQDGEMVLVADTTQDIYDKERSWTDEAMSGAGFSGSWSRLEGSYRLPPRALSLAQEFAVKFLPKEKIDLAEVNQGNLDVEPCTLRWIQCAPEESKKKCVDAVLAMMRETGPKSGRANADITFICNEIAFGKTVTDELDTYNNIRTIHTFETDRTEQVRKKMAFWKGDARIKATTLHSFKGWESQLLVVHVGHAVGDSSLASIYAALTRLKGSPSGSFLTIVCSAPELARFGEGWP